MKHTTKLLSMTAALAVLSMPAMADNMNKSKSMEYKNKMSNTSKMSAFDHLDSNRDGKVSMNEFENNSMHDNEPEVFKMYDQNDDGFVTRAELEMNSKMGGTKVKSDMHSDMEVDHSRMTTNMKSKSGQPIGSMDQKYYIDNPFVDGPEIANSEDTNINIDNPFVDDPEIPNSRDTNWNLQWPKTINRNKPIFPQVDVNNSGFISQTEFMAASNHDNEADVFAAIDRDQSGYISKTEFNTYGKMAGKQ